MKKLLCLSIVSLLLFSLCSCKPTIDKKDPNEYENSEKFEEISQKTQNHISVDKAKANVEAFLSDYQVSLNRQTENMKASESPDAEPLDHISYRVELYKENVHEDDSVCGVLDGSYICLYNPETVYSVFKVIDIYHFGEETMEAPSQLYENVEFVVNMTTGEVYPLDKTRLELDTLGYPGEYKGILGKTITIKASDEGYIFTFKVDDFEMTGLALMGLSDREYLFQSEEGEVTFKFSDNGLVVSMTEPDTMSGMMIGEYSKA